MYQNEQLYNKICSEYETALLAIYYYTNYCSIIQIVWQYTKLWRIAAQKHLAGLAAFQLG